MKRFLIASSISLALCAVVGLLSPVAYIAGTEATIASVNGGATEFVAQRAILDNPSARGVCVVVILIIFAVTYRKHLSAFFSHE